VPLSGAIQSTSAHDSSYNLENLSDILENILNDGGNLAGS
jgi:hypothetical protein